MKHDREQDGHSSSFEYRARSRADPVLYAHASRTSSTVESNPGNARALVQQHGDARRVDQPTGRSRSPPPRWTSPLRACRTHASRTRRYGKAEDPRVRDDPLFRHGAPSAGASVAARSARSPNTKAGSSRAGRNPRSSSESRAHPRQDCRASPASSADIGGPTANMYRHRVQEPRDREAACRKPSCVYPRRSARTSARITRPARLSSTARRGRSRASRSIFIASGLRYDLAVRAPELRRRSSRTHHVGGYLKIAPEHVAEGPALAR